MVTRLTRAAERKEVVADQDPLAALDSATLAQMLLRVVRGPSSAQLVSNVSYLPPSAGRGGGFTYIIKDFWALSERRARVESPFVEVGGLRWSLLAYPGGHESGEGSHLSGGSPGT
jgi:hypothetical protein